MNIKPFSQHADWRAYDIESSGELPEYGLQPWSPRARLTSFATSWFQGTRTPSKATTPRVNYATMAMQLSAVLGKGKHVVAWNAPFDAAWAIHLGLREEVMRTTWVDAMLLWKHVTRFPESDVNRSQRKSYKLKAAVAEFYPQYAGYEEGIDFHDDSDEAWAKRLKYNQMDAIFTLRLAQRFWDTLRLDPQKLRNALIEAKAIPEVADHIYGGLHVDKAQCRSLRKETTVRLDRLEAELLEQGVTPKILASPVQLRKVLFDDWGLPVLKLTDKKAPSTDKDVLEQLGHLDERANVIAEYRKHGNLRTKFTDKILESCEYNEAPITHPTANMGGTYTGRMTFSSSIGKNKDKRQTGYAKHQMSAIPDYRRQIIPPAGHTILELDAAGQEYRWMAIASGDTTMLSLCEAGEDPHASMGAEVVPTWGYRELQAAAKTDDPSAYKDRKLGKVCNLSCQYRIGKPKFRQTARVQYAVYLSEVEANNYHDAYHRKYPGIRKYWKAAVRHGKIDGYARTYAGREVSLDGMWNDPKKGWMLASAAINFPIQGTGADQKYLAIAALRNLCRKYNARFYFELHDGIYYIVPNKYAMKFGTQARKILNNLPYLKMWGFEPPIPLPWDLKLSDKSWGDMKEVA